jgi:poly-gamma-glutamate capsule biosynthesis protein CapA/YwtB (metallophosphatase superfamily)
VALHLVRELRARRRVWPWLACVAAFAGGLLVGVLSPAGGGTPPARAGGKSFTRAMRLEGTLPAWLAPGAPLTVTGWAGPNRRVSLVVGGRRLVSGRSGSLGRFVLTAHAPGAGRPLVEVTSDGRRVRAGRLLVRPILLAAAGDVTPGEGVSEAVDRNGDGYPWTGVARVLRSADVATVNLEGAISSRGEAAAGKQYHFRGGAGLLRGAARAGIDLVTVANNHSLDYGREAFLDTIGAAHRAGLATVGGGATLDLARRPAILTVGGLRIAVLGYSDVRPLGFDAGPDWAGTAPAFPAEIAADVAAARRRADLVVVWLHWGVELQTEPNGEQRALAATAFAAGATLVLGAHPHVLQPVTREGRRLVAWSLGNFVFPSGAPRTRSTGILLTALDARGVRGFRLERATIHGFRPELDAPPRGR